MALGGTKSEVKKRKLSDYGLSLSLGLTPPPTSEAFAALTSPTFAATGPSDEPILAALYGRSDAESSAGEEKFILNPATILPDPASSATSFAGSLVEFAESSQTAQEFVEGLKELNSDPNNIMKSVVVLGNAGSAAGIGQQFRQTVYFHQTEQQDAETLAVKNDLIGSEENIISDPLKGSGTTGGYKNCACSTIFMKGLTGKEHFGGDSASVFLNFIPSAYLSQAVPFFDLEICPNPNLKSLADLLQSLAPHLALGTMIGSKKKTNRLGLFNFYISDR